MRGEKKDDKISRAVLIKTIYISDVFPFTRSHSLSLSTLTFSVDIFLYFVCFFAKNNRSRYDDNLVESWKMCFLRACLLINQGDIIYFFFRVLRSLYFTLPNFNLTFSDSSRVKMYKYYLNKFNISLFNSICAVFHNRLHCKVFPIHYCCLNSSKIE
jgi:hypothetical protein